MKEKNRTALFGVRSPSSQDTHMPLTSFLVPDAIFAHPRLAPLYDAFDGDRADLDAYLRISEELGAQEIVDIGCGTGYLAILLAQGHRHVIAVDPAQASLDMAMRNPEPTPARGSKAMPPCFTAAKPISSR